MVELWTSLSASNQVTKAASSDGSYESVQIDRIVPTAFQRHTSLHGEIAAPLFALLFIKSVVLCNDVLCFKQTIVNVSVELL